MFTVHTRHHTSYMYECVYYVFIIMIRFKDSTSRIWMGCCICRGKALSFKRPYACLYTKSIWKAASLGRKIPSTCLLLTNYFCFCCQNMNPYCWNTPKMSLRKKQTKQCPVFTRDFFFEEVCCVQTSGQRAVLVLRHTSTSWWVLPNLKELLCFLKTCALYMQQ